MSLLESKNTKTALLESEYKEIVNKLKSLNYKIRRLENILIDYDQDEDSTSIRPRMFVEPNELDKVKKELSEAIKTKAELCIKYPFCCN